MACAGSTVRSRTSPTALSIASAASVVQSLMSSSPGLVSAAQRTCRDAGGPMTSAQRLLSDQGAVAHPDDDGVGLAVAVVEQDHHRRTGDGPARDECGAGAD